MAFDEDINTNFKKAKMEIESIRTNAGGGYEVGDVIWRLTPTQDSGKHLLDGALINGSGSYAAFVTYIAGLVTDYPDLFVTEADWQSSVTTYGSCGKFVYNATDNTVRLPKVSDILQGTTDVTALGDLVEAGLPNITGSITNNFTGNDPTSSGCMNITVDSDNRAFATGSSWRIWPTEVDIDTSRSSSIYGNSTTVQPQTIKAFVYIVVANSTKTDIQVDIDQVSTDLNGKADTDLSNVPASKGILTESYVNGTSWYRVWSDGWCEQGGCSTITTTITLLKAYTNTNYTITMGTNAEKSGNGLPNCVYNKKTASSFYFYKDYTNYDRNAGGCWQACGYIR